jgi:tetratricopeptide (TPR) repeat protein
LLKGFSVESASVLRAALELFRARQFPGVAAVCAEAVETDPDNLYLRLLRARALLALRDDGEAKRELAECCRREPRCAEAYRLLGELGIRTDEPDSAAVFLREALRLDPGDTQAAEWLGVAQQMIRNKSRAGARPTVRPATAGEKLPAAPAVAGRSFSALGVKALGTNADAADTEESLPAAAGFGRYLLEHGVVTEPQLRAALAYKRATGVKLGRAVTTLGFASELKIEWAALAYHGRHRRSDDAAAL